MSEKFKLGELIRSNKFDALIYAFLVVQVVSVTFSISVSSIAFALASLFFVMKILIARETIKFIKTSLDLFLLAFILVEIISSLFSEYMFESFIHARRVLMIIVLYATLLVFRDIRKIFNTVFIIGIVSAIVSLLELITYYIKPNIMWLGIFQHPMTTGGIKMIVLLLLFPFYLDREIEFKKRTMILLLMAPIYLTFLLSFTRSSWFGFLAGLLVVVAVKYRYFLPGWVALAVIFYFFFPLKYSYRNIAEVKSSETTVARYMMWKTGARMFMAKPVLGWGDIDLYKVYLRFRPNPEPNERHGHLHNNFIMWLVLFGSVGFMVLTVLFLKYFLDLVLILKEVSKMQVYRDVVLSGLGVLVGFNVNGLFEWNFGDAEIMTLFWFIAGLVYAVKKIKNESDKYGT